MRMSGGDLYSNGAYMVMAALAWNLKAWYGLLMPDKKTGREVVRMEFPRVLNSFAWDMALHLGDFSGNQGAPEDDEGAVVVKQSGALRVHARGLSGGGGADELAVHAHRGQSPGAGAVLPAHGPGRAGRIVRPGGARAGVGQSVQGDRLPSLNVPGRVSAQVTGARGCLP